jgi:hypothetical protein
MTNPFALNTPAAPTTTTTAAPVAAPAQVSTPAPDPFGNGEDPFSGPAPQRPRGPRLREMHGRLLLIVPKKVETVPNNKRPGETQERMTADVVVLDGGTIIYGGRPEAIPAIAHDKQAEVPLRSEAMFISSVGLVSQCREALAKRAQGKPGMVLGRLSVGEAKGDNNPPYLLTQYTEADKAIARQYLAQVDPFA